MPLSEYSEYRDDMRTVYTHTVDNSILVSRPYTAKENAEADIRAASEITLRTGALAQLAGLMTSIDALQVIINKTNANIGPGDTKNIARELRRVIRQVMRLTRLSLNALDSSDVGVE